MKKIVLGLITLLLSLVLAGQFVFNNIRNNQIKQNYIWVTHTYKVIVMAGELKYAIASENSKIDTNFDRLKYDFQNLENMVRDNPNQIRLISDIKKILLEPEIDLSLIENLFDEFIKTEEKLLEKREEIAESF